MEHLVYQSLVGGSSIFEAEGHYLVAEKASACDEGRLLLVSFCHLNLVVAREGVHEAE
jgi:hypothetical protein